jgi:glycine reductase complex component B subunit alpha and beta
MRLELNILKIGRIQFGDRTGVSAGVLTVSRSELQRLLLEDPRFREVEIELTHPGEKCRILKVLDVIEPRAKTSPGNEDYPGVVGPQAPAGTGTTCVLKGVAVVLSDFREKREVSTSSYPNGEIIDMSGPGAEAGTFGRTCNVVLLATPSQGVTTPDYMAALKVAGLKTSAYLARAGKGVTPDETQSFELPALTEGTMGPGQLPRIVYIFQVQTLQFEPIAGEPVLYGRNVPDMVPTLIHPNEVLDGAVTSALPALNVQTYHVQNHPIIRELYKRHGKELTFAAVIITLAPNNVADIERVSNISANLAKYVVGAEGAVLTKTGGGAPELTMARTAQRCEQLGVKTAIAMLHMGADISDAKYGATTIFSMPEVDAIVSMGIPFMELELPAVDRIIGRPDPLQDGPPIQQGMVRSIRWIKGSQCQLGSSRLKAVRY